MNKIHVLNAVNALAVADAVGNPLEFGDTKPAQVISLIASKEKLNITDDTQMTLFGLMGIADAYREFSHPSEDDLVESVQSAYLDWYDTQTGGYGQSWLSHHHLMRHKRAPGNTCLGSLETLQRGGVVKNDSKGCGVAMRMLPFAILAQKDKKLAREVALRCGAITHQHPEVRITVLMFLELAEGLLKGQLVAKAPHPVAYYGTGWTSMECFNMGQAAFSRADDYEDLLVQSIAHKGDSDSVAAVAGSLWGIAGKVVPEYLLNRLEERAVISAVVTEFNQVMENQNG